jgi:nucleotide-binding universal stress UspA family protein
MQGAQKSGQNMMGAFKTILHPTDQSECSRAAFRVASALAHEWGARLVILEVVPPPVVIYGPPTESYLNEMRKSLDQMQVPDPRIPVERRLAEGNPAAEILQTAADIHCDMIVMGSHGRTGLKRLVVGSVAEEVMRRAAYPVLIAKAPLAQPNLEAIPGGDEEGQSFESSEC